MRVSVGEKGHLEEGKDLNKQRESVWIRSGNSSAMAIPFGGHPGGSEELMLYTLIDCS